MIRKMISVLLITISAAAMAVEPWQHELRPGFPEPFDFVLVPWAEQAEPREMDACWRDGIAVPFLGADFQHLCFQLPLGADAGAVSVALRDAGYSHWRSAPFPGFESPQFVQWDSFQRTGSFQSVQVWRFEHPDGVFVSFGYSPAD